MSPEAAIAKGSEGDELSEVNQKLGIKIADYKKAAAHCKKHVPKPKAAAKSAATPQSS